jgi:hypothetical protein
MIRRMIKEHPTGSDAKASRIPSGSRLRTEGRPPAPQASDAFPGRLSLRANSPPLDEARSARRDHDPTSIT